LGVKWAVFHPGSVQKDGEADIEASVKANMVNFNFAVELAAKLNVGVAYENMPSTPGWPGRFSSKAEDLIGLVDAYSDENIGICWDFGHGNMIYEDQTAVLKKIGKRLKATHVADNYKRSDDHMMTFHGSTDWESIMPALKEIGYEGAFAFEAGMETKNMPEQLKDDLVRLEYKTGKYCLGLAK
jgi:sugar phosphate isomerase/epimerase